MNSYFFYIVANWNDDVLYIGVTNNLERRIYEHRNKLIEGFSSKYNVNKLVYFEESNDIVSAIAREKQVKNWNRKKKEFLIETMNPQYLDLTDGWYEDSSASLGMTRAGGVAL